jgi:hypothetical protein
MATFDDGSIFEAIATRLAAIVGENVPVYLMGDKAPLTDAAWVMVTGITIAGEQSGVNLSADGSIDLSMEVCAGDAYKRQYGKYAIGSLVAKLREHLMAVGFSDAGATHTINIDDISDADYGVLVVENAAIVTGSLGASGRVVRNAGTGTVTDFSE